MLLPQFPWTPDIIHPQSNLSLAPYPALLFFTRLPPPHEIRHSSTSLRPWYPPGKTLLGLCTHDWYTALLNKHLMNTLKLVVMGLYRQDRLFQVGVALVNPGKDCCPLQMTCPPPYMSASQLCSWVAMTLFFHLSLKYDNCVFFY